MLATFQRSSLGECISSFLTGERHLLVALEAYFDGSNSTKPALLTLAGFAAEDSTWIEFDKQWKAILSDSAKRPVAKYIHMREANALECEFAPRNGWNQKKVSALILDLLLYLKTIDKERFRMCACTVDLLAREKLKCEGLPIPEAVDICNDGCPKTFLFWYAAKYPGLISGTHYFFDKGEPFRDAFEKTWVHEKSRNLELNSLFMYWSLIKTVTTADMKDKPGLQAADLLAWATNRYNAGVGQRYKFLLKIMQNVIPWYEVVYDEKKLREVYSLKVGA